MIQDPITTVEAAVILDRDPSAIRHMIRKGKIAYEKRGRDNYVSRAEVRKIRAKREQRRKQASG